MAMKLRFFILGACFLQGAGEIFQGSAETGRRMNAGSPWGSSPPECYADSPNMQCIWDAANALRIKAEAYAASIGQSYTGTLTNLYSSAEVAPVACFYQSTLDSLTEARCSEDDRIDEISTFLRSSITASDFNCSCNVCPRYRFMFRALASVMPQAIVASRFLGGAGPEPTATELGTLLDALCPFEDALTCLATEGGCAAVHAPGQMGFLWEYLAAECAGKNIALDDTPATNEPLPCKPPTTVTNTSTATATMTSSFTVTVTVTGTETSLPVTSTSTLLPVTSTSVAGGETTETTAEPEPANVVEVTLTMTVDDPTTITEDETLTTAMVDGFADLMGVDPSLVTLTFEVVRRLGARRLQVTLRAIFTLTMPTAAAAEEIQQAIEAVPIADTNTAITAAVEGAGYNGTIAVTGKETVVIEPEAPSKAGFTSILTPSLLVLSLNF